MSSGISSAFGSVVRKRRLAAGLSQETLAEKARLHPTYVSMVERGVKNPTLDAAERIAEGLDIPLSQIIEEAEKQPSGLEAGKSR